MSQTRVGHRSCLRNIVIVTMPLVAVTGCLLTTSFDGLSEPFSQLPEPTESGLDTSVPNVKDAISEDAFNDTLDAPTTTYASCAEAHAALPDAPSGRYRINSADGGAVLDAYCDMVKDDGGWMLVTEEMIASETKQKVTTTHDYDVNGGVSIKVTATARACGSDGGAPNVYSVLLTNRTIWTQIRAKYIFMGVSGCWSAFGSVDLPITTNVLPFERKIDAIRDEVKMGGITSSGTEVDPFDGILSRCDGANGNFWSQNATRQRSVELVLRRDAVSGPAGLGTLAACVDVANTWWGYRDIYIR